MKFEWAIIPQDKVPTVWPVVQPMLAKVVAHSYGELTEEMLWEQTRDGQFTLWMYGTRTGIQGCALTQLIQVFGKKSLEIVALAGVDILKNAEAIWLVEEYARKAGAQEVLWYGRSGFKKVLADYGYVPRFVLMGKSLKETQMH